MSLTSLGFFIFVAVCVTGYYLIGQQYRWVWLLLFSYLYYLAAGPAMVVFLLFVTLSTFFGATLEEAGKKWASPLILLLNFGLLAVLKYAHFMFSGIGALAVRLTGNEDMFSFFGNEPLLLPLGISFYMFQATGYLLDVRWKRCEREKNVFRYALFVSFFPQIMQGPIGRYKSLSQTLFAGAAFDGERVKRGLWRVVWGVFKKLLIADNAARYADLLFDNYMGSTRGCGIAAVLFYGIQLYMDFSGGVDIVIGIGEMLGITMDENFRQPFFATSITDFWHRWHITLGTWMKDYLFYPISLSRWMGKFGKWSRKKLGKQVGRALPICIANVIVFLVVGIWHGAAWHYIIYGLYNGLIIGISGMLAPNFRSWKKALHINDKGNAWHAFQVVRTFILVNISWFFDRGGTGQALHMMLDTLPWARRAAVSLAASAGEVLPVRGLAALITMTYPENPAKAYVRFLSIVCGLVLVIVVSVLRERKVDVRGWLLARPAALRLALLLVVLLSYGILGNNDGFGGFIYANF